MRSNNYVLVKDTFFFAQGFQIWETSAALFNVSQASTVCTSDKRDIVMVFLPRREQVMVQGK